MPIPLFCGVAAGYFCVVRWETIWSLWSLVRKGAWSGSRTVALTPTEFDILRLLMQHAGTVFSPREIYRRVWGDSPVGVENAVAVHIRHLRSKIEIDPTEPRYLKVVWGKGNKMEERRNEKAAR